MDAAVELPQYRSHKVVRAARITDVSYLGLETRLTFGDLVGGGYVNVSAEWVEKRCPLTGGYFVLYDDGYTSYSPAKAFEEGYTKAVDGSRTVDHLIDAKIIGTRPLSDVEAALINEGKALAEACGDFVFRLRNHPSAGPANKPVTGNQLPPLDQRWVSIGATHLQEGFMAITRGIAQPTTF